MKLWPELRALVYLKRIAIAAESIAASQRNLSTLSTAEWERKHPAARPRATEISTMDIDKIESEWRKEQEARMEGVEPE